MISRVSHCLQSYGKSRSTSRRTNRSTISSLSSDANEPDSTTSDASAARRRIFLKYSGDRWMTSLSWGYEPSLVSKMILLDNKSFRQKLFNLSSSRSSIASRMHCGNQETFQWPGCEHCPSRKVLAICWANHLQRLHRELFQIEMVNHL